MTNLLIFLLMLMLVMDADVFFLLMLMFFADAPTFQYDSCYISRVRPRTHARRPWKPPAMWDNIHRTHRPGYTRIPPYTPYTSGYTRGAQGCMVALTQRCLRQRTPWDSTGEHLVQESVVCSITTTRGADARQRTRKCGTSGGLW